MYRAVPSRRTQNRNSCGWRGSAICSRDHGRSPFAVGFRDEPGQITPCQVVPQELVRPPVREDEGRAAVDQDAVLHALGEPAEERLGCGERLCSPAPLGDVAEDEDSSALAMLEDHRDRPAPVVALVLAPEVDFAGRRASCRGTVEVPDHVVDQRIRGQEGTRAAARSRAPSAAPGAREPRRSPLSRAAPHRGPGSARPRSRAWTRPATASRG